MTTIIRDGDGNVVLHDGTIVVEPPAGAPTAILQFTTNVDPDDLTLTVTLNSVPSGVSDYRPLLRAPLADGTIAKKLLAIPATTDPVVIGKLTDLLPEADFELTWIVELQLIPMDGPLEGRPGPTVRLATDPIVAPTPITITNDAYIVIDGGEPLVGASFTVQPPAWEGSPLTAAAVTKLHTSNDNFVSNDVEAHTYTGTMIFPEEWAGLKVRPVVTLVNAAGSETSTGAAVGPVYDDEEPVYATPAAPQDGWWSMEAEPAAAPYGATRFVINFRWHGPYEIVAAQWLNTNIENFPDPPSYDSFWNPTEEDGGKWVHLNFEGTAQFERNNGTSPKNVRIRVKTDINGPWSPTSITKKIGPSGSTVAPGTQLMWYTMDLVTPETRAAGLVGGSQEQRILLAVRSVSDPSCIVMFQDTLGPAWVSYDDGQTFERPSNEGLFSYFSAAGGAVDPADDRVRLFAGTFRFVNASAGTQGIYRTTDGGDSWTLRLPRPDLIDLRKCRQHFCDWDRSKTNIQNPENRTWFWMMPRTPASNAYDGASLLRSDDGGKTWVTIREFPVSTYGRLNGMHHHPNLSGCLYICFDNGLWRTTDGGVNVTKLSIAGYTTNTNGTSGNKVMGVQINPAATSLAATELYVAISNKAQLNDGATGIWRSTNGGNTLTKLTGTPTAFSNLFVATNSSGLWDAVGSRVMYALRRQQPLQRTANGGGSWMTPSTSWFPGAFTENAHIWNPNQNNNRNPQQDGSILPHPTNPLIVFAHAGAKDFISRDGGLTFGPAGDLRAGQQLYAGHGGLAFCEGNIPGAQNVIRIGVTDKGMWISYDGGYSFHFSPIRLIVAGEVLNRSCNVVTQCPTDKNVAICSSGHTDLSDTYMAHTTRELPGIQADGSWTIKNKIGYPHYAKWHKTVDSVCYGIHGRYNNAKVNPTYQSYGNTFIPAPSGRSYFIAAAPSDNDIIYAIYRAVSNNAATTEIRRSTDRGVTGSTFFAIGYNPREDDRAVTIAVDPTDPMIFWIPGPSTGGGLIRNLRRYNKTTNNFVEFDMITRFRTDHPAYPSNMRAWVADMDVDPSDRNTVAVTIEAPSYCAVYITRNAFAGTPTWELITKNLSRLNVGKVKFSPHTGDLFLYTAAAGGCQVYPPETPRAFPTLTANMTLQNV